MSAVPRHPDEMGYAGLRMTADEYLALGETEERYELIHGVVVVAPSPLANHNEMLAQIIFQLGMFAQRARSIRVFPETDVRFPDETVYRPDISVYRSDRLPAGRVERLEVPPDLVVEVLSAGTKALDLITKRDDYERFGVGEYWVVDPLTSKVRIWRRQGTHLLESAVDGDSVRSTALDGFVLDLRPLRSS